MGTLDDLFRRFEQLNDIGASLSSERDLNRLLEKVVLAAKAITRADSGRGISQASAAPTGSVRNNRESRGMLSISRDVQNDLPAR